MIKVKLFFVVTFLSFISNQTFAQYNVGNNDGFAYNNASYNPLESLKPYNVGNDDGFSYSESDLLDNGGTLPVDLLWFTAECEQNGVLLQWSTASETNNDFFILERSSDTLNFQIVGTVTGASNSNQILYYSFLDAKSINGNAYYRLKQTDFDGNYKYSNIISATCNDELFKDIKIYPNPVTNELTIELIDNIEIVNFEIINSVGTIVYKSSFKQKAEIQTSNFAAGAYIIKFEKGTFFQFNKVIKQ